MNRLSDEEIAVKHLEVAMIYFGQIGVVDEITDESSDDDKMFAGDIRYHIYSAIENALAEARKGMSEEIERLKSDLRNEIDSLVVATNRCYDLRQENDALRTKFNGLVGELKKARIGVDKAKSGKEYLVAINKLSRDVQSILTKYAE